MADNKLFPVVLPTRGIRRIEYSMLVSIMLVEEKNNNIV